MSPGDSTPACGPACGKKAAPKLAACRAKRPLETPMPPAIDSPPRVMGRYGQVAAFILAGGQSSRMGQDKCLLELAGLPLVVRTARLLAPLVAAVTVVGPPERYLGLGLDVIAD